MRDYFDFFMKFVFGSILLMPSVDSAVCDRLLPESEAMPFARAHWLNSFKWEDEFVLKDGSVIKHTEHGITLERDGVIEQLLATFKFEVQRFLNFYKKLPEVSSNQEIFWGSYYNLKYSHQNLPL